MPFQIIRNNIIKVKADAIVNTANPGVAIGGGVDSAIYEAAGSDRLFAERVKIGELERGQAAVTPAFALNAKYIIHTVGPVWLNGESGEFDQLRLCYTNSLKLAKEYHCGSIAFPLISTGIYGFPKDKALQIAISVISDFLLQNDMSIYLVVFDKEAFELSGKLFDGIEEFIDANYVEMNLKEEYSSPFYEPREVSQGKFIEEELERITKPCSAPRSLDDVMKQIGESFQERLLRLIDERQLSDVEVYKKANLDRKLFSKIRCNTDYKPKKKTAVALAIALELSLDETRDLLGRAELALSPSNKFDLIIEYFIENEVYDVYTINMALFKHDQPMLGE